MSDDKETPVIRPLSREEVERKRQAFKEQMSRQLRNESEKLFTTKGASQVFAYSITHGAYWGKEFALYISKNMEKEFPPDVDLAEAYLVMERMLKDKVGDSVYWRSNRLVDHEDKTKTFYIEFIPMSFKGSFLLQVLEESSVPPEDAHRLIHAAVMKVGELFHEVLTDMGFTSSYPRAVVAEGEAAIKEMEECMRKAEKVDFHVEIRYIEKSFFTLVEHELVEAFSESELERYLGMELIKEAIPFMVQYEVKEGFPDDTGQTIAKPEFIILEPLRPIAIYCDSKRYHKGKQVIKDRRIDRKLQGLGFVVFRFSEEELVNNLRACAEEIRAQYLGGQQYALTLPEDYMRKLARIDENKLSMWEARFIESIAYKAKEGEEITLKEEAIIHITLKKHGVQE